MSCRSILPTVEWETGHNGISGNEKPDELAWSGSDSAIVGPLAFLMPTTFYDQRMGKKRTWEKLASHTNTQKN